MNDVFAAILSILAVVLCLLLIELIAIKKK
jgi:hypothetical protein